MKRCQENSHQVQETHAGAAVAPLPGHSNLYAPYGRIIVCIFRLHSQINQFRNDHLIVVKGGHPKPFLYHVHAGHHKLFADSTVEANRQVRLGQPHISHRFKNQETKLIYRVFALCGLSPDSHILVEGPSCRKPGM